MNHCRVDHRPLATKLLCLALCWMALAGPAAAVKDNSACPDLSGHYRIAGFGPANHDALKALRISMAGFTDSEVRFEPAIGKDWDLFIKSGGSGALSRVPSARLTGNAHHFELLILPAGRSAPWRPTLLWVEQEMRRTRHPLAEPGPVLADPLGYRVSVTLSGDVQAQDVARRILSVSGAFAEVQVQNLPAAAVPAPGPSTPRTRSSQLLLVMK